MALLILAHPNFNKSIANKTIVERLQKSNLDIEIRNLHALYPDFSIDVQAEQDALLRHNTVVFQYPFYWYNMPAILKQWFDYVFVHQFAYGFERENLPTNLTKADVLQLRGKVLGCHCKPLACHGDVLADYLNSLDDGK